MLRQWFSYRKRGRTRPRPGNEDRPQSELNKIQRDHCLPEYTSDLMDLLNVLGRLVALEPRQVDLLNRICDGTLISLDTLRDADVVPVEDVPDEKDVADDPVA